MTERAIKSPTIVDKQGKITDIEIKPIPSEKWLQQLLPTCPDLLPVYKIDPNYSDLTFVCSEASIKTSKKGTGHVDLIFISKSGRLVLVETKLYRNPESCRAVLGQILDYAANIRSSEWDYDTLNMLYKKSDLYDDMYKKYKGDLPNRETFIQNVNHYIKQTEFLMLIVGDTIRIEVENIVDFINSPIDRKYKLALCEIRTYEIGNKYLVISQVPVNTKYLERAVITIKNDNIVCETTKESPSSKTLRIAERISEEKFIGEFVKRHPSISETAVYDFLNELRKIGLSVTTATKHVGIGIPKVISLFEFSEERIWFVPSAIEKRLKGPDKSAKYLYFLETIKPFLTPGQNPYKVKKKFYMLNLNVITSARKYFVATLNKLKDKMI